jgi:hypothetical protein
VHGRAFLTPAEAAAIVCAGLLASPFLLGYDLTLLAISLVWLFRERLRAAFWRLNRRCSRSRPSCRLSHAPLPARQFRRSPLTVAAIFGLNAPNALRASSRGTRGFRQRLEDASLISV